ncbi:MAG TPA: hypothetical protein VFQ39_18395, partial [Longimicrobium sp.]|nr:hypothetical protein [Longimicrobium sp.]
MYRHCIYCSAELGANEALEAFPVGRALAFDAAKGRLWAICPKCARWNLSPLEERWEAVEAAEKLFVDTRFRVQAENVGLARLLDGTRLVRVGAALPGELAAWRYGGELARRRRMHRVKIAGILASTTAFFLVTPLVLPALFVYGEVDRRLRKTPPPPPLFRAPGGKTIARVTELWETYTGLDSRGRPGLVLIPHGAPKERPVAVELLGDDMWGPLARLLAAVNAAGATPRDAAFALERMVERGGPEAFLRERAAANYSPTAGTGELTPGFNAFGRGALGLVGIHRPLPEQRWVSLAMEMAVHEETERRAMEGELA